MKYVSILSKCISYRLLIYLKCYLFKKNRHHYKQTNISNMKKLDPNN